MRSSTTLIAGLAMALTIGERPAAFGQNPVEEHALSVNGVEIYYQTRGEGPPLLLLHTFGGCGAEWEPHVNRLAEHYRLIVPDLRGQGRSTDSTGDFTHRQAAIDIFAVLDHLGIDRLKAMGMSSGGMTLIHMATQQPERIEAMVLIGATTHFPEQARAMMRRSVPDSLSAAEMEGWGMCSSRGAEQTEEILRQFNQLKDNYDDMNFTEPYLSTITARTLVVHGDRDEFFPVDIAFGMYRAIPDAALWIIPNGGHIPILGELAPVFQGEALAFLAGDWKRR
jgi:pimeloyl-ACP methyl ester carboxylesterase